jgi:hypothetical protein
MERALRQWLDSHGLLAISAAVIGVIVTLSVTLVLGFYLMASPNGGN